jgi:hypothetical protein
VYYNDWKSLLQGLGRVIQRLEGPITGIGTCSKGIGRAYYRDWEGVFQGLERPTTRFGTCNTGIGGAYYRDWDM